MHWVFAKILRPRREQIDKREGMGTDWGAVSLSWHSKLLPSSEEIGGLDSDLLTVYELDAELGGV